jgi:transketolase
VELAVDYALSDAVRSSVYLRLVSVPWDVPFELPREYRLVEGRGVELIAGRDAVLFAYGPVMLGEAVKAAGMLRERHGFSLGVFNLPWLNRVDLEWLTDVVAGVAAVFTLDNHLIAGGQGDMLLRAIAERSLGPKIARRLGVEGVPLCGQNHEVLRAHGLDAEGLCATVAASIPQVAR